VIFSVLYGICIFALSNLNEPCHVLYPDTSTEDLTWYSNQCSVQRREISVYNKINIPVFVTLHAESKINN